MIAAPDTPAAAGARGLAQLFPAPALLEAGDDPALDDTAIAILVACYALATQVRKQAAAAGRPWDGRIRVKTLPLAIRFNIQRQTAGAKLDLLVARGYLSAEGRDGNVRTFRVIPDRGER